MLPSEELLQKYRTAEKSGASEPAPDSAVADKEVSAPETKANSEQPATESENQGQGTTDQNTAAPSANSEGEKDGRTRYQRDWEKRLKRQERSHQAEMAELRKEFDEYKRQHEAAKPELKPEDFPSRDKYEEYKESQMEERVKNRILEEQRQKKELEEADAKDREKANQRMKETFKTDEAIKEFKEVLRDFTEDEKDFLESENGLLYQEFMDNSPVGLIMTQLLAKNAPAFEQLKGWSKDMMLRQLENLETALLKKAAEAKKQTEAPKPNATQATKPTMPSTGAIGKTTAASGTFDAKSWLRQNRPERYK